MVSEPEGRGYVKTMLEGSAVAGWTAIMVMMVLGTADMVLQVFGSSIPATVNWTEIFNVLGFILPLAYVTATKAHIVVELFTLRGMAKRVNDITGLIMVFLFMALLAWQLSIQAWESTLMGEFDQVIIKIYWFPAKIALALAFIGSAIVVIFQLVGEFRRRKED